MGKFRYAFHLYDAGTMDRESSAFEQRGDNRGAHGEFGYTHRWSDTHTIDANVGFNHWGGPSWNSYLEDETWPDDRHIAAYREQEMPINTNSWEARKWTIPMS